MRAIVVVLLAGAADVLAHAGHGMPAVHLHGWDYLMIGALAAFAVVAAIYACRK